ncbi:MAG: hypothetical protein Q8O67_34285 [Deltaproteobacteria bacterium]|nr:hypothetical protein [Deltaproteobacteria bacterium]
MKKPIAVVVVAVLFPFVVGASCTASSFCNKRAQCLEEEENIDLEDDSTRVCVAEYEGALNALFANEEEDCHTLANAQLALDNCRSGLDCDDFLESDLGGKCDDQLDDLEDAFEDISGFQCSAQD